MGQKMNHGSLFKLSPPPRNLGHWWSDISRKGDNLSLWSAGNPSLHMAVGEERPRVKEYEIIRLNKITRAAKYNVS